jgi:hypothetical protein
VREDLEADHFIITVSAITQINLMATSKNTGDFIPDLSSKDVDILIANELSAMSIQEREQSYYDVHGVSDTIDETPEFVQAKLKELDYELTMLSKNKDAYLLAEAQDREYVTNINFRLKFLRADTFETKIAAQRLVFFFEEKLKLFGPEKLARDIKISDLDEADIIWLESGIAQLLPQRDRSGRCVLAWIVDNRPNSSSTEATAINKVRLAKYIVSKCEIVCSKSKVGRILTLLCFQTRVLYYLAMAATEDEEVQKKGMISVMMNMGNHEKLHFQAARMIPPVAQALPIRWSALHVW